MRTSLSIWFLSRGAETRIYSVHPTGFLSIAVPLREAHFWAHFCVYLFISSAPPFHLGHDGVDCSPIGSRFLCWCFSVPQWIDGIRRRRTSARLWSGDQSSEHMVAPFRGLNENVESVGCSKSVEPLILSFGGKIRNASRVMRVILAQGPC